MNGSIKTMGSAPFAEVAVVFDAYAWVEYALDGPYASSVSRYLEGPEQVYTPASVIAELKDSMLKKGISKASIDQIIRYIRGRSAVVDIDPNVAELAGEINFQHRKAIKNWGMLDSFVYAVAKAREGRVLTGDPHFKHLRDVTYLGD